MAKNSEKSRYFALHQRLTRQIYDDEDTGRNMQYKRNNKYNHELTNTHLAANNQYYCQQCKRILNLADKRFHLQSNEHKNSKRMWYCDVCKKDININTKSSHIKSATHIEN